MWNSAEAVREGQALQLPVDEGRWYAVTTRPRHEKKVADELARRSVTAFLPLVSEVHRWSDRRKTVEMPLFPGYVFVRLTPTPEIKVSVLKVGGVLHFVGSAGHGAPISDAEIDSIRAILGSKTAVHQTSFLRIGQRVRVRGGVLDGVEGILAECGRRLVVSVNAIQRSVSVTLEGIAVEPV